MWDGRILQAGFMDRQESTLGGQIVMPGSRMLLNPFPVLSIGNRNTGFY